MLIKVILGFMLLHVSLFGGEFKLSSSFFSSLHTEKSKAIFQDYERFMNETNSKPLHVKLEAVNFYINAFVGAYDEQTYRSEDYWASRWEFLENGGGDCEDYVIAKFYTLKDLGTDPSKMALSVVQDMDNGSYHMVLLFFEKPHTEPLVLDNLSFKILPLSKRYDLKVKECMNEEGYFKLVNNELVRNPSRRGIKNYVEMLKRNQQEPLWQNLSLHVKNFGENKR